MQMKYMLILEILCSKSCGVAHYGEQTVMPERFQQIISTSQIEKLVFKNKGGQIYLFSPPLFSEDLFICRHFEFYAECLPPYP